LVLLAAVSLRVVLVTAGIVTTEHSVCSVVGVACWRCC
jgi:hypothetical protein